MSLISGKSFYIRVSGTDMARLERIIRNYETNLEKTAERARERRRLEGKEVSARGSYHDKIVLEDVTEEFIIMNSRLQ